MAEGIGALLVKIGADTTEFVSALNTADKAVGKFTTSLDRRLLDPIAKVTGAFAAAGTGIFMFAKSAAETVDQLGKMSQKIGVSVESLSALKYAAELSDVSLDQLGTGLKQLSKYMVENNVQGVTTEEQLLRIADEFAKSADGAGKTAAAMKYFGKAGADLIPLLNAGRAGIEELRKEAQRLGIVFSTEAAKKAEEFNDNLTRLKASAQGVHVELAGPFIKALNDSAVGLLNAKKNGDGFVATLGEMIRLLVSGNDTEMWRKEMAEAANTLLNAQNRVDALKRSGGSGLGFVKDLREAQAAAKAAEENIKRLRDIGKILAPEAHKPADGGAGSGDKDKPQMAMAGGDVGAGQAAQDAMDEEARIQSEAAQAADDFRAKERAKVKENLDALNSMRMAAADAEQEAEIAKGEAVLEADGLSYSMRMELFRQSLLDKAQLEQEAYDLRLEQIQSMTDAELELVGGRQAVLERMEEQHQDRLYAMGGKRRKMDLAATQTFLGYMSGLMQTNSKKMFEIGKASAIAETVINTYKAAMGAYSAMASIPYVGPILGAAAAAAAVATGMAQVNNIRSQTIGGGGGGGGAAGTFDANPSTGLPTGTPGGDVGGGGSRGPAKIFNINVSGSSRGVMEEFAAGMNRLGDEGFQFRLNGKAI